MKGRNQEGLSPRLLDPREANIAMAISTPVAMSTWHPRSRGYVNSLGMLLSLCVGTNTTAGYGCNLCLFGTNGFCSSFEPCMHGLIIWVGLQTLNPKGLICTLAPYAHMLWGIWLHCICSRTGVKKTIYYICYTMLHSMIHVFWKVKGRAPQVENETCWCITNQMANQT